MTNIKRVGDLEINQDLEFQKLAWRIQRIGWVVLTLIVLAALLGLFGEGPLSSARAGNQEDGLWLAYPLFVRNQSQYSLTIHVTPQEIAGEKITLIIADRYLQNVEITSISPTPSRVAESTDGLAYEFEIMDQETSPSIIFFMSPDVIGSLHATVELVDGASINFRQFVYP